MNVPVSVVGPTASADQTLALVVEEFTARLQAGEPVDVEAYVQVHPEQAKELRELLPALHLLADLRHSRGSAVRLAAVSPPDEILGTLGDFQILRELGRGGMGVVYEADQISLGRRVALKVLPFAGALDAKQLQRFKNEAQAAAHLHHQHIVPVYFVGCERSVHFYAMQFIDGQTLAALIAELRQSAGKEDRGTWPEVKKSLSTPEPAETLKDRGATSATNLRQPLSSILDPSSSFFHTVAQLGIQAAEALEHAHQIGVVHRDIKPANLLVESGGHLWITDFGLAHCQGHAGLTMSGDFLGTLRYMSPEQALGKRVLLDERTDIYSLGATLYELLTLEAAFPSHDRQEVLRQIAGEEPRPPQDLNKAVPLDLQTIVLKAMAKDPSERYNNAQELAEDLGRFVAGKPILARPVSRFARTWRWCRRNPMVAGLLGAALALAVGLAVLAVLLAINLLQLEAEQQRVIAEEARKEAALKAEADLRGRAEENLKLALRALDEIVLRPAEPATEDPEGHLPLAPEQLEQVESGLLQKGLEFYDQFAQANRSHAPLRGEVGKAYQRVGLICAKLRVHDKAELAFRKALPVLESLVEELPTAVEYRRTLLSTYHGLGHVLKATGRPKEAEGFLRQDLALAQQLAAEFPAVADYRGDLCHAYCELGGLFRDMGRQAEADQACRQALDLAQQLVAEASTAAGDRRQLYSSCRLLGQLLSDSGHYQEAEQPSRQALDLARQLLAAFPTVADHRQNLVISQERLARLLIHNSQLAEAEQSYRQTITLEEKLAARFPDVVALRNAPARSHVGLGDVLWVAGRFPEVADEYRRALDVKPDDPDAHWKLAWFLANCPEPRYRDPGRAVEQAKKALERTGLNGHYWKALGLASYRAGNWGAAIGALQKANFFCGGGGSYEWFALAMAHWRRGDQEQARQWYTRACRWMEDHKGGYSKEPGFYWEEEFRRLRAEAAGLLGLPEPPPPAETKTPKRN
ncbi:MAG TPA: protein kinase [Gemmataceae bacterium]|jgi:serine/threonine protein kinase|nr:protein kinase [Gemmataceae bacterium]